VRATVFLLLAALPLAAQDEGAAARVREALDAGEHERALALAGEGLRAAPHDGVLQYLQAQARCGVARDLQRTEGYAAAVASLEPHVGSHALVAHAYARTALWAGEEERALRVLAAAVPDPKDRVDFELELLGHLRRYREVAKRARAVGWEDGAIWAEKRADLQDRLEARAHRGRVVAGVAAIVLLGLALVAWRTAPRRPAPA